MAAFETSTSALLIGEIAIAAAALERALDRCVMTCLPALRHSQQIAVISRLSFRQRLDIVHELALPLLDGGQNEPFKAWRRRVAKVWARSMRMMARGRLSVVPLNEVGAQSVIRHLSAEAEATHQWSQTLNSTASPAHAGIA